MDSPAIVKILPVYVSEGGACLRTDIPASSSNCAEYWSLSISQKFPLRRSGDFDSHFVTKIIDDLFYAALYDFDRAFFAGKPVIRVIKII